MSIDCKPKEFRRINLSKILFWMGTPGSVMNANKDDSILMNCSKTAAKLERFSVWAKEQLDPVFYEQWHEMDSKEYP